MDKIFLYNSLSRKKEEFKPIKKGRVGLYTCGPTVYNFAHIGNLRSYVFADILARVLRYNYGDKKIKWVMNITDVDDKTIRDSKTKYSDLSSMEALKKFTAEFESYFWKDLEELNINHPSVATRATDIKYIRKMQKLVEKIFKSGYGYIKDGSVYFDVVKYSKKYKYGKLVDIDKNALKSGTRIDSDEYEKENVQDFVLWKGQKEGEPYWDFKLDKKKLPGRPGWHIECSAMSETELGCPFDIHTGGIDLKFPHHENEIHQSVIGYGAKKPVNFWLHNEHLLIDGQRMGKRFKNFYIVNDLKEKKINPLAYRFLCLQTHYGKQMNFTWEALKAAEEGLSHLYNQFRELGDKKGKINVDFKNKFLEAVNDDLNMPKALAVVQKLLKSKLKPGDKLATILDFDKVLGLNLEESIREITLAGIAEIRKEREIARKNKDFKKSDELRDKIEKLGYRVEDTSEGMKIFKK